MDIDKAILKIIQIPETLSQVRTSSISSLLQESGYFEIHSDIDERKIYETIKEHPKYVKVWLQWSDDKRSSPSPYFRQTDDGRGLVGYYPGSYFRVWPDIYKACAVFIKLDMEQVRVGPENLNLDVLKS